MNLMAAPNSNVSGSFKIMDWYIYDNDPVDQNAEDESKKTSLMNNGFGGSYTVSTGATLDGLLFSNASSAVFFTG